MDFDLKEYLIEDTTDKDKNSAVIIITDNQMIMQKTFDDGEDDHIPTIADIYTKIYDVNLDNYNGIREERRNVLINNDYQKYNIVIKLLNENNCRVMYFTFPDFVSLKQLEFLKVLEKRYGPLIKEICEKTNDSIIGYKSEETFDFSEVVEYASSIINEYVDHPIKDKKIIGKTISDFKTKGI